MSTKRGYTIVELLVAIAAASILSITLWNFFDSNHRSYLHLYKSYDETSMEILKRLLQMKKDVCNHHKHPLKTLF